MAPPVFCLQILFALALLPQQSITSLTRRGRDVTSSRANSGVKVDCYKTLCANPNATFTYNGTVTDCSFLEDCQCRLLDEKSRKSGSYACSVQCPKLPRLRLVYDGKGSGLSATCLENTEGFDPFFKQFRRILDVINPRGFKLFNCHKPDVEWEFYKGCKATSPSFADSYDVSQIPPSDRIQAIELSDNCITDFHGNFPLELEKLEVLEICSTMLTAIHDKAFHNLRYLGELHLYDNRIKTVTQHSFKGLLDLHTLNLAFNQIESLPEDLFEHLRTLLFLNLNGNRLRTLPAAIFGHATDLGMLVLDNNELEVLPYRIFENLTYVSSITLNGNKLSELPDHLFDGLMQLDKVGLSNNELEKLPNNMFRSNFLLRELDISSNYLNNLSQLITPFEFMGQLAELKITNNNITVLSIPLATLKSFASSVDMSHNCLVSYQAESVLDIPSDYDYGRFTFTCTNCCIRKVRKELINGVSIANFENNRIDNLDMEFLKMVANMEEVDLSYNLIRHVDIDWEYPLIDSPGKNASKTTIRLYHNPVMCDCEVLPFLELIGNITKPPRRQKRSKMIFDVYDMYCIEPPHLYGVKLDDMLPKENELARLICNITGQCPRGCHCYDILGDNVKMLNCTSRGTSRFPTLGNYGQPINLHLENNTIGKLPAMDTWTWSQMRELYLDNNNLTSMDNLIVFPTLKTLSLRNNSLTHLPMSMKTLFTRKRFTVNVLLSGNPWECSCALLEMRDLMTKKDNVLDFDSITCIIPQSSTTIFLSNGTDSQLCQRQEAAPAQVSVVKTVLPVLASIVLVLCICSAFAFRFKEDIRSYISRSTGRTCLVMK